MKCYRASLETLVEDKTRYKGKDKQSLQTYTDTTEGFCK